jgi:hypothetical protein
MKYTGSYIKSREVVVGYVGNACIPNGIKPFV